MFDKEFIGESVSATQQIRAGQGYALLDNIQVVSPAGSPVAIKTATFNVGIKPRSAFRVIIAGAVANNANAKSITLGLGGGFDFIGPITPAINTANKWYIECIIMVLSPNFNQVFGVCRTGPDNGVVTQTVIRNGNVAFGDFTVPGTVLSAQATQVAAADVSQSLFYIAPVILPT